MNKIIITGGAGFLGSHLVEKYISAGHSENDIFVPRSADYDLVNGDDIDKLFDDFLPDRIIHLAAIVGGIGFNGQYPGDVFYKNIMMGTQLMEKARTYNVKKFVSVGTICSYPKFTPVPFKENTLWDGYPEETNASYGLAKKMMIVQSEAYRQQYDFNSICILPVNLYGPRDNFNLNQCHVIPALIRKIDHAKLTNGSLAVWGTGTASREFLYVEDAAEGLFLACENYDKSNPVNLGSNMEITIRELVATICDLMNFENEIIWDSSKPDGQPRRCLDVTKAKTEFGFEATTDFINGLKNTIDWYDENKKWIIQND
jgi:GDP-L-fucose synthase